MLAFKSNFQPTKDDLTDLEVLIILLEDRRYFEHCGFDWQALIREIIKMIFVQKHGGASTIDMQFVRTKTGYREQTFRRKVYEIVLAVLLQYRMNKLSILRAYLGQMYLGHGINGIYEAARQKFNCEVWDLDRNQSAVIAAMMVYPKPSTETPAWQAKIHRRSQYGLKLFDKLGSGYKQRFE